jgi:hypothetical protein
MGQDYENTYKIFINIIGMVVFTYLAQALYNFQREKKAYVKYIIIASLGANVLFYLDKYIGMELRAIILLPFKTFYAIFSIKTQHPQSIVFVSITYAIALAVGDMSAVFYNGEDIWIYSQGYKFSSVIVPWFRAYIIYGMVIIIILSYHRFIRQTQEMTDKYKRRNIIRTSVFMLATFIVITVNYANVHKGL